MPAPLHALCSFCAACLHSRHLRESRFCAFIGFAVCRSARQTAVGSPLATVGILVVRK